MRRVVRHSGLILLGGTIVLPNFIGTPVYGQQICGASIAVCDLQVDEVCLEKTYACGEYDTVIQTLFVEEFAPTADQIYYIGASFFGKHIRERSKGMQCEMVKFGREYLTNYLSELDVLFTKTGSFGPARQMDRLYHATQMLKSLNEVTGCPESAFTPARIKAIARNEALEFSKNIFLNPKDDAKELFKSIQDALMSFVSRASDLETGIALRRIEARSAKTHLDAIKNVFKEIFGSVSGDGQTLIVDTQILDELGNWTKDMQREVKKEETRFKTALGGVSTEEYAKKRSKIVDEARKFITEAVFHIGRTGELLPTDPASPFARFAETVNKKDAAKSARDDLAQIRTDWKKHGDATGVCSQPGASQRIWYCR